jgi:hypothetical protein
MGSEDVRRSAARVRQIGDDVRRLAHQTGAASAVHWYSPAAMGFRQRLAEQETRIRAVALELDGAAEALLRHAVAVDGAYARLGGRP